MAGTECSRPPSSTVVFSCSGAADVGAIADLAARALAGTGEARMSCAVGLGGRVEPLLETARTASTILAIDGCPLDCTKRSRAEVGREECLHLRITDLGMPKGASEPSEATVAQVVAAARSTLEG
jgi:uncharacterized metal-binding protein